MPSLHEPGVDEARLLGAELAGAPRDHAGARERQVAAAHRRCDSRQPARQVEHVGAQARRGRLTERQRGRHLADRELRHARSTRPTERDELLAPRDRDPRRHPRLRRLEEVLREVVEPRTLHPRHLPVRGDGRAQRTVTGQTER